MGYRVGVDIGGSFTDFAILNDDTSEMQTLKVFSRPDAPGEEVMSGLSELKKRYEIEPQEITYFTHGTTVGVNTVIQRKGLKLALITTRGFADVLEIARLRQPNMFDLLSKRPVPLISRDLVFEVDERVRADGSTEAALDEESVRAALRAATESGAEGIVISLLHSYRNPVHELEVKRLAEEALPGFPIFRSSEIWPIIREYERTITATIGGYVQPRVERYLSSLQSALRSVGVQGVPHVTKSNGGVMTAEQGKSDCVQMILSGTAAGVIGADYVAKLCGIRECMSLDIGGTSADVAIINEAGPQYGIGEYIGEFQIFIPSVSVTSIGDGGGSIAWVDNVGVLQVGPESAGSTPGPACFSRGGTRATITDAFAVCGVLGQLDIGYDAVSVDVEKARVAIQPLAEALSMTVEETAEAIIKVAVSGMYTKISGLVTRFGLDPRTMALMAFGGAGPMLGGFLARELAMSEIVIPTVPGVLSALGGLIADIKNDFIKTVYLSLDQQAADQISSDFDELRNASLNWLREQQDHEGEHSLIYSADMRYQGQSFEIEVILTEDMVRNADLKAMTEAFHDAHLKMYGHSDRNGKVQVISVRLVISGVAAKPELPRLASATEDAKPIRLIDVWLDGAFRRVPFYKRGDLRAGHKFSSPAVISQDDCTTCVPVGFTIEVDEFGNLRVKRGVSL